MRRFLQQTHGGWYLPRRTFLKGAGLSVALPLLDAMTSARRSVGAETGGPPPRLAFVFFPNGAIMDAWKPAERGEGFRLSETMQPLAPFRDQLTVISGLAQDNGRAKGDGPGDHARCAASYLTGAHPFKTSGANIRVGVSVDQVAADRIGHLTRLPSLELGIERGRDAGGCDSGYSCAYSSNISWKTDTTPMAKEIHPRLVFERMFGSGQDTGQHQARRNFYRQSVLDLVAEDAAQLKTQLGQTDRRKVDEFFTSVRELEQRIAQAEQDTRRQRPDIVLPDGIPGDPQQHVRLMYDLLVLAFRTDTTRVATYMLGNAGSNRSYAMVDVNEGHHELSHHGNEQDKVAKLKKIDRYLAEQFAYFLQQLQNTPEGQGSLLDHCAIVYGSGLSDGNRHRHDDLPIVLAGRAGGTFRAGRHVVIESETPLNNLFLSLLDYVGANVDELGDSSGRLTALQA